MERETEDSLVHILDSQKVKSLNTYKDIFKNNQQVQMVINEIRLD